MADKKNEEKGKGASQDKKVSPEDLEKTQLDVNIRDLEKVLDETMIFKRPPVDEEDTDLHRLKKAEKEIAEEKPVEGEPAIQKEEVEKSVPVRTEKEQPITPSAVKKESRKEKKEKVSPKKEEPKKEISSVTEEVSQGKAMRGAELLLGLVFLMMLLDAGIEGLAVASPLSTLTMLATLVCLGVNIFSIFKKGNYKTGLEVTACVFLGLVTYSTWKYGSGDPQAFTVLKHPPSYLFNFLFLALALFFLMKVFAGRISRVMGIVFAVFLLYGIAGIVENLSGGVSFSRIWNLEDTLLGTRIWSWAPYYYIRPTIFSFWIGYPLLLMVFSLSGISSRNTKSASSSNAFTVVLLLMTVLLSSVILQNNRIPNLISFFSSPKLGVGQVQPVSAAGGQMYDVEVTTSNVGTEKGNDMALQYRMGAFFDPAKDGKKMIGLAVRGESGKEVPFLKSTDLLVLQEQVPQKPIKVQFMEDAGFDPKIFALLVDRSSAMTAFLSMEGGAVRDLYDLTNSREKMYLASFAEDVKGSWVYDRDSVKKWISGLLSQGSRNLEGAVTKAAQVLESQKGKKAIFVMTGADAVLPDSLGARLKSSKIKLYVLAMGDLNSNPSLKSLVETTGGKAFGISEGQGLSSFLLGSFADAFSEYKISYEGQSFTPKLKISSPENGAEISTDTSLILKILNASDVKVKTARLSVEGKVLQEGPAVGWPEVAFPLSPSQLPRGTHVFKASVITEDGKEYSEDITLNVVQASEFRFIRPLDGDVVSGQVNLEVYYRAKDQNPLTRVDFLVDGQKIGEASAEPYLYTWESQGGSHTIQAVGNFADGATKTDQIKVSVSPGFFVRLVSPSVGEFLSNLTEIEADVTHNLSEGVQKVEFFADGEVLGELNQPPYKYLWDNSALGAGRHVIQARAHSSSNAVTTDAVVVNIGKGSLSLQMAEGSALPDVSATGGGNTYFSPDTIEWILDASSSMNGQLEGVRKIDLAKQAMGAMLSKLPMSTQVTYRWFGSQSLAGHHDCKDSVQAYPLKNIESNKILTLLSQVEAQGLAPLGFALDKVRTDMKTASGSKVVILITDGFDNCGGDPVGQLDRWKKEKLNAKLYVVGLDLAGTRAETELKRLASLTGGQYFSVHNLKEFLAALEDMVKVTYTIVDYKGREIAQRPVGAPAISLRTGEYRVEVDLAPPLVKDKVLINNGVEKKLLLKKEGTSFQLEDQ
ncbi:MAG: Ig-like domain-containing protein [bacterium]